GGAPRAGGAGRQGGAPRAAMASEDWSQPWGRPGAGAIGAAPAQTVRLPTARPKSAPWGFSEDGAATHAPRMVPPQPGRQFRPPPGWAPTNPTAPALEHWRVDNRWLNAPTKGLVYRRSPRVEDRHLLARPSGPVDSRPAGRPFCSWRSAGPGVLFQQVRLAASVTVGGGSR
ncbi:unnamed protein product, partial [Prorocentrum cordatum]